MNPVYINKSATAKEIVVGLDSEHSVTYTEGGVYKWSSRNREHVEARQAELSKALYRFPIIHAHFQLREITRIFKEAGQPREVLTTGGSVVKVAGDHAMQLKCLAQAADLRERVGVSMPESDEDKKEAEEFLKTFSQ